MPRTSKLTIIAGGSVLCVAAVTSMTAITCPAAASAATVTRESMPLPASVAQERPAILPASALGASLISGSLSASYASSAAASSAAASSAAANAAQWAASFRTQEAADHPMATTAAAAWGHTFILADVRASAVNTGDARLALRARQAAIRAAAARAAARAAVLREAAAHAAEARAAAAHAVAVRKAAQEAAARRAASSQPSAGGRTQESRWRPMAQGSPQQIAQHMLDAHGQGGQFSCLNSLWQQESGWNVSAQNPGSGAYGIPQALPGSKMASAGPDWQSSAATQIAWGLSYIDSTYGSPCAAWTHERAAGWY